MPSTSSLLTFLAASVLLIVVPGPSVLFIVGRALAYGRRAALASVAGNTAGVLVLIGVVAAGLGPLAERSIVVFDVVKLVGAAYLVYLGIRTFRERGELAATLAALPAGDGQSEPARRFLRQGFLVGLTNPKALVYFAAVLPQFVDPAAGGAAGQIVVLGLVFCALASGLDSVWGLTAGVARNWFATSPARLRRIGGAGGLMIVGMGVGLALTGRKD